MSASHPDVFVHRPPIVLTTLDYNRLYALLSSIASEMEIEPNVAQFLREELDRAVIVHDEVAITSLVTMGSEVKFIDHDSASIRRIKLVYPDDASNSPGISVLTPIGSALIALGPGQSITWNEYGNERKLTVLEVLPASK